MYLLYQPMAVVSTGKIGLIIPGWSAVPTGVKEGV
jgi:hypothetical protein